MTNLEAVKTLTKSCDECVFKNCEECVVNMATRALKLEDKIKSNKIPVITDREESYDFFKGWTRCLETIQAS